MGGPMRGLMKGPMGGLMLRHTTSHRASLLTCPELDASRFGQYTSVPLAIESAWIVIAEPDLEQTRLRIV